MPENEFEKQVKELMEELHFSPSAPVWEKIKKRITEKKHRRVWPIFFLFISIATLGGYFFYADTKHHSQNINKNIKAVKTQTTKSLSDNTTKEKNKKDSAFILKSQQLSIIKKTSEDNHVALVKNSKNDRLAFNQPSITNKINKNKSELTVKNFENDKLAFNQSSTKKNNTKEIIDASKNALTKTQISELNTNSDNKVITNSDNKVIVQQQKSSANNISKDSFVNSRPDLSVKINSKPEKNNSVAKEKKSLKKIIKNNKWQFGVTAMYGVSNISNKAFNLNGDKSLQGNSALNNPGWPIAIGNGAIKNPYNKNSAYNFGLTVQRKIFKNSSLNTGINLVHLSSKTNTALNLDSSLVPVIPDLQSNNYVGSFYRIGSAKTYTNNFNFIEIPVTFQSNLFHVKNFSVLYDAGISAMQLISSKALIYDNHTNSFFSNDALFRKTQFQLMAGLNFQLKIKNSGSLLLGPDFNYSLSSYLKDNNYSRLHFIDYGAHVSWIFNKK